MSGVWNNTTLSWISLGVSGPDLQIERHVTIHLSAAKHPGTSLMSLRLCKIWWDVWMKMVWCNRKMNHGYHWCFYLKNHTSKTCHGKINIGVCVCPTRNWTRPLTNFTSPYLAVMLQYRTSTQKKRIYFCRHGKRVLWISGGGGGMMETGIIHPWRQAVVESDAYGRPE